MNKEIHISQVPLTPRGVNHDFNAVKDYEFVRYDEIMKVRTKSMMCSDDYKSDNEVDLSTLEIDEQIVDVLVNSPMIEVRKNRKSINCSLNESIRFNPIRDDILETSAGSYHNYQQNRRKTIAVMKRLSSPVKRQSRKLRQSTTPLPIKENLDPALKTEKELELLVAAVDHSQTLLNIEKIRLSDFIKDWSHILERETDIPLENQGDIESAIGGLKMLLENRFQSTLDLLDAAESYVNNNGIPANDTNQHYLSGDIIGFMDLLIDEIKKIDNDFKKLYNLRSNNWVEDPVKIPETIKVPVKKIKKGLQKKPVQSKIDMAQLRMKYQVNKIDSQMLSEETVETDSNIPTNVRRSKRQIEKPAETDENINQENDNYNNDLEGTNETRRLSTLRNIKRPKSILKRKTEHSDISDKTDERINLEKKNDRSSANSSKDVIKTPISLKKGIRSKSILKSDTGTPVHEDTPRPNKIRQEPNGFAVPSSSGFLSKNKQQKRASHVIASDYMTPKKPRKSVR